MKTTIVVRLQLEGVHKWAKCPYEEVKFLRDEHRHIFWIECEREVFHDDRDVEFIMFKRDIIEYLEHEYFNFESRTHEFGAKSCEMLAKEIMKEFDCCYVSVFEDNENGAEVYL